MTEEARKAVEALRICHSNEDCRDCKFIDSDKDEMSCVNVLFVKAADLIESLSEQLEQVTRERDAAICDINMLCQCDVCTWMCKYDKPNPYCECANFEWRGVQ